MSLPRRLRLAARYLWVARPLYVLGVALWAVVVATELLAGDTAGLFAGGFAWGLLVYVGSRVTVSRRVHREVLERQRFVSPPM